MVCAATVSPNWARSRARSSTGTPHTGKQELRVRRLAVAAALCCVAGLCLAGAGIAQGGDQCGGASWYGPGFNGQQAASGEIFNQNAMTAAHKSLPFGSRILVKNQRNDRAVVVRINDRGPYVHGRILDLSRAAAIELGFMRAGVTTVCISHA